MAGAALKKWQLENGFASTVVDPHRDALYGYDAAAQKAISAAKPWKGDPHYFKHVRVSAVALLKMVMHARSGGSIEVMGLMQGYTSGDTIVVTDAFRLPVEGTETRVNAQAEADEYMVNFLEKAREVGQMENAVGWYHSHPGYGCWLSGIDVATEEAQQKWQDPFVAVVVDPERTVSAGKVEIGAFRTYPEDYTPPSAASGSGTDPDGFQTIPMGKIEDFGAHASRYYPLGISHYKSSLDARLLEALWEKYWVGTLSASPLLSNREYGTKQIADLAGKVAQAEQAAKAHARGQGGGGFGYNVGGPGGGSAGAMMAVAAPGGAAGSGTSGGASQLEGVALAGQKIAAEEEAGLLASEIKDKVFNLHAGQV